MDHGDHSGHSGHTMPMPSDTPSCSMNMLWNSQVADTCVVFRSWHIKGWMTMAISCIMIILISLLFSMLVAYIKQYERTLALTLWAESRGSNARRETAPIGYSAVENPSLPKLGATKLPLQARVTRALLYAVSVAISFFLMLVAMTYNTYLFGAIVVGAFMGHLLYESEMDINAIVGNTNKGLACH